MKNMNSKMTQTHNYQNKHKTKTNELSKQLEQEQNHRNGDHMEGYISGDGVGENRGKGTRE